MVALRPHVSCLNMGNTLIVLPRNELASPDCYLTVLVFGLSDTTPTSSFRGYRAFTPHNLDTDTMAEMPRRRANKSCSWVSYGEFVPMLSGPSSGVIVRLVLSQLTAPISCSPRVYMCPPQFAHGHKSGSPMCRANPVPFCCEYGEYLIRTGSSIYAKVPPLHSE